MKHGLLPRDLDYIIQALRQFPEVEVALIFGSRAKGNYTRGSDVDLAIRGERITPTTISRLSFLLNEEYPLPYFFDVVHYETLSNSDLIEHIDRVGEIIFEQSSMGEH
ncbi:MAG: nucleotidyltransferase domain-containing protein [Anaerolineae bacterium]